MTRRAWIRGEVGSGETLYGVLAEFATPAALVEAVRRTRAAGYRRFDAYAPFPIEGLSEALSERRSPVALWVLGFGVVGGVTAYGMQWFAAAVSYPIDVGGRPYHSAPAFVPVTFELTVLFAALGALLAVFVLCRLPEPYHPVFNVAAFERASQDRFFVGVEADDGRFDLDRTQAFLLGLGAEAVHVVKA
jgi:hypothetical protein